MQGGCGGAEERERGRREDSREVKWWECEVKRYERCSNAGRGEDRRGGQP